MGSKSTVQQAEDHGVHRSTVWRWSGGPHDVSHYDTDTLLGLYRAGRPLTEIAAAICVSPSTVYGILGSLREPRRPRPGTRGVRYQGATKVRPKGAVG